ncbi:MAG: xanthine dehydrogenase family protein molybdopterin-binding subunit [Acidimicrobiales bacterium]
MSILGNRVLRREDPKFLTVGGDYVDDLRLPGACELVYVYSPVAHARIARLDAEAARAAPGVLAVFTAAELDLGPYPKLLPAFPDEMVRPLLADGFVRYVGEPVAAILAEDRYRGADAAELVEVDYEPLPALVDPEAAEASELLLHPAAGSNVIYRTRTEGEADFSGCEVVVEARIVNQRIAAAPIEPRAGAAYWDDAGRLVHYSACQGAHPARETLAKTYGLELDQVRVIVPDVGGGFGAKARVYPEEASLGWFSRQVGRPVRWTETRTANMTGLGHGRGQVQRVKIGGRRDGAITAYQLSVIQDGGAYPLMGSFLPFMTQRMTTGVYELQNAGFDAVSVATTTTPVASFRGAGRPEAAAAIERAVDLFAAEIGLDPAEVRRANLVAPFDQPYTSGVGTQYDVGDYVGALDRVLAAAGYAELRAEQAARRAAGDRRALGIGLSVYVEVTAGAGGGEYGELQLRPDGTILAKTGSSPHGQGHLTTWAMIVSDRTGVAMDQIEVVYGDTDLVPSGGITGGSRSAQLAGSAMADASLKLVERARARAAELLEAAVEDVVLDADAGRFHVAGAPAIARSWAEVAAGATAAGEPLAGVSDFAAAGATFPFGAHVAVVEVDLDTGQVELVRLVACDDAGTILNPLLVDGQVHGGLAAGAGQALFEEVRYDAAGNPLTVTFADYALPSAAELPSFERVPMETPTFMNPLGAKGIGESGTIGSTPAIQNAVVDALAPLGVRHIDLPCTPERVWRAIQSSQPGRPGRSSP